MRAALQCAPLRTAELFLKLVEIFRFQVRVAPQHGPILVTRNQRHPFDRQSSLKKPACRLMSKIMEVKIFDLEFFARTAKCGPNRSSTVREHASLPAGHDSLLP